MYIEVKLVSIELMANENFFNEDSFQGRIYVYFVFSYNKLKEFLE